MNTIQIQALLINLIIYLFMTTPVMAVSLNKKIYTTKKTFISSLFYCTIFEIIFSTILYIFPNAIFSLFTKKTGIINYAIYSSKIIFMSSSLFALKILIPANLYNQNKIKKVATFIFTKIAILIVLIFIFYNLFNTKGILFSFPICDFIFYVIYILEIIRY